VQEGDYRLKECLQKIIKDHGDIEYHELKAMVWFKTIWSEMAHKEKWKPDIRNRKQCNEACEHIKVTTKNMADQENWNSLLEKCIKNVYI
jgi:hypothetical protein